VNAERADSIVHTEKGTLHCICPATGKQRYMAFQGFEANRNTLKYLAPKLHMVMNVKVVTHA
jgi:hypothetical protein